MYDQSQFIYRIQPTRTSMLADGLTDVESRIVEEHATYLQSLARENMVLLAGRTLTVDDGSFGIVILNTMLESEARKIMEDDPAVLHGVMRAELFPYNIAILSDQIALETEKNA